MVTKSTADKENELGLRRGWSAFGGLHFDGVAEGFVVAVKRKASFVVCFACLRCQFKRLLLPLHRVFKASEFRVSRRERVQITRYAVLGQFARSKRVSQSRGAVAEFIHRATRPYPREVVECRRV